MNEKTTDLENDTNKKSFTDTVGNAVSAVGTGVKTSVSSTMGWIRNFFFKVWGMVLLTVLTIGALIVLLAFAVSILDGTTSFKRLCGNQSIASCLSIAKDAPIEPIILPNQSSPTQRSLETDQVNDEKELELVEENEVIKDNGVEVTTE